MPTTNYMEINITSLLELDAFALSHSQMEGGENAGPNTWNAAKEQAEETPLLDTEEKLQAMRDFARESGGWSKEEIEEWDAQEVNALFLQWIAGDVRQMPAKLEDIEFEQRSDGWYRSDDEYEYGPYESRSEAYQDHAGNRIITAESLEDIDWDEVEDSHALPGNLFKSDDGEIYFYLGN